MNEEIEQNFVSIKEDFNRIDGRFDKQDELLNQIAVTTATILEIVKSNDIRIKELEARVATQEKRILRLEKKPV